jgi:RNA polymerase sigma-70 factor (ECF subfamily)
MPLCGYKGVVDESAASARGAAADEAALFARVVRRDASALRVLYDRHGAKAMAIAVRILHSSSEAEEIVQETFVEVWRRAPEYDRARGSASSWIAAIARSRAIDRLRSRGTADRTARDLAREPEAPATSPLEDVEHRRWRERIQSALGTLPDEQRAVLEQAYFEGLTQREIADKTGQPLGTVKTRVRLALEKLGQLLGGGR